MNVYHLIELVLSKENIVHAAAAFYLAGFLFRDQVLLRSLIVLGDLVYVLYFFYAPETPLWGGIFWSSLFIAVNMVMLAMIILDRKTFGLNREEIELFEQLGSLSPGQFRKLRPLGEYRTAHQPVVLVVEGERPPALFYVLEGDIDITKANGYRTGYRSRDSQAFVGEVAFLLGRPASATVTLGGNARYFAFDEVKLHALLDRSPEIAGNLRNAMNRNMAAKIALSGVSPLSEALT